MTKKQQFKTIKELIDNRHYVTDKFTSHSYLDVYEQTCTPLQKKAKNILEIGISHGGSIRLWHDYFLNAQVYGVDVVLPSEEELKDLKEDRITLLNGNAYDMNFVQTNFIDKGIRFDLIIDDGDHTLASMCTFAKNYSRILAPGGAMIIEDIPVLSWTENIKRSYPVNLFDKVKTFDLRQAKNRWDDIMSVLTT